MHVTLIYNPSAGDDGADGRSLQSLLEAHGHVVLAGSVKEDGWEHLLSEPAELVVAAGGDGTIRKVFRELATSDVAVTILPIGSANNIARTLGLAEKPLDELVAGLGEGARRPFDLGVASAPWGDAVVVESFGGGLFAEVISRAVRVEREESKVDLGLQLLAEAIEDSAPREWQLETDGTDRSGTFLAVEAMNIRETGPNMPLAPEADPADRHLDLVRIRAEDREPLLGYVQSRLAGEMPEPPPLDVVRAARLTMRPVAAPALRVDDRLWPDDPVGAADVVVSTGELAVAVVIPELGLVQD
jgi:diacylglycerol kinase (ATP)